MRFLFIAIVAVILCSCASFTNSTPEAKVFFTLSDVKTFADAAEKVYGNQVALGHVSLEKQKAIDEKIIKLHSNFSLALRIAKSNPSAASSSELQKLADDLVLTVNSLAK